MYFLEDDLNKLISLYAPVLAEMIDLDSRYAKLFNDFMAATNLSPIDLENIGDNFASKIVNEIIIKNAPGYNEDLMKEKLEEHFKNKGINKITIAKGDDTSSRKYMKEVEHQLGIAFIFLPG